MSWVRLYKGESRTKVGLGEFKLPIDLGGGISVTFNDTVQEGPGGAGGVGRLRPVAARPAQLRLM